MDALESCSVNYAPLTPLLFLERAADYHGDRTSIVYGSISYTWSQTLHRCRKLASALVSLGINVGDVVSAVGPNIPAIYELHFGVPMAGAVLNTLNIRLNAHTLSILIAHSDSKIVFVDHQYLPLVLEALRMAEGAHAAKLVLIRDESMWDASAACRIEAEYESFIDAGDPAFETRWPASELQAISLNYTSGTTANPKGVIYHHRGAFLNSLISIMMWGMKDFPVYLWTVPMFHCNGWCFPWAIAAQAGTNVCMRTVTAKNIFDAIAEHGITHLCAAPTVLNILSSAPKELVRPFREKVHLLTGGAPASPSVLARMENLGFEITHAYGMTEATGLALYCRWKPEWDTASRPERAALKSRQGMPTLALTDAVVMNPKTMYKVPRDGKTVGEVMVRGNAIMKGYFKDKEATEEAFRGGWYHTGDLGVVHSDGYIQLKDRSKDIIISGGENISSIEVESVLYSHPKIVEAAVVGKPDNHWGETPCAFVCMDGNDVSAKDIITYCRAHLPHYMAPRFVVFRDLPKSATGKIQKNVLREWAKQTVGRDSNKLMSKL